ncbi:MAG: N-acetylglucosamine-6-phosphate deacetylase [Halioglobus sp.]|jgi:N-acetylglucosamine-6-phosphate deacetylase
MPNNSDAFAIASPTVFDGEQFHEDYCVVVRGKSIVQILPTAECPADIARIILPTGILAPGLIDLQVNGGGDVMLHNAPSVAAIETIQAAHRGLGTTAMLPTLLSDSRDTQKAAIDAVSAACAGGNPGVLGLHIEGPYFNKEKRGAHSEDRIRPPTQQDVDWLSEPRDFTLVLTLAPEEVKLEHIQQLSNSGVVVCAGHTQASYARMSEAVAHGLQGVTHLYNAMGPVTAREPGVIGATLDIEQLWAGIIADGHHVHPASIRMAHHAKASGKLLLVSDAMATVGGSQSSFTLYDEEVHEQDGRLVNAQGNLAGSTIGMIDAVRYCYQEVGIALEECLRMASLYPATAVKCESTLGRLCEGFRADLVHFDENFQVHNTWLAGQQQSHHTFIKP